MQPTFRSQLGDRGPGLSFGIHGQLYLRCRELADEPNAVPPFLTEPRKVANGTTTATFSPTATLDSCLCPHIFDCAKCKLGSGGRWRSSQRFHQECFPLFRKRRHCVLCYGTALEYSEDRGATAGHQRSFGAKAQQVILDPTDLWVLREHGPLQVVDQQLRRGPLVPGPLTSRVWGRRLGWGEFVKTT